ncbi:MAG: hypothetical protein J6A79_06780 [Clostridia bacterium]|nr:hypothetical protein [Clostridia bacterium]
MLEQKERYVVTLVNGKKINSHCGTFRECLDAFGEELIKSVEKLDYDESTLAEQEEK